MRKAIRALLVILVLLAWSTSFLAEEPASAGSSTLEEADDNWLSSVQQQITEEEYYVTWQNRTFLQGVDASWHAPNRAHGFRTYFTENNGIRVIPRTEDSPSWEWGLALAGYGRGGQVWTVPEPSQRTTEGRLDYDRGEILEWYINNPRGLEQGFKLFCPPERTARSLSGEASPNVTAPRGPVSARLDERARHDAVFVELALGGSLEPAFSTDGQAIDFHTAGGINVIHLAELLVTDAGGHELPAWMEGFSGDGRRGIRIVFDDTGAAYPVTIDPLATSPAWTAESNQAGSGFGLSVGTAGDVNGDGYADVAVGAYSYDNGEVDEGRVFVFHGSATGLANIVAWTAEGDQISAFYGIQAGTAGDVNGDGYSDLIVGARLYDNGQADEGSAFVYHGSTAGLSGTANWTAESDQAGARFGGSVGTAGDVNGDGYSDVIVGSYFYDNGQSNEGRAFVFHGSSAGLSVVEDWTAEGDQAGSWYGNSVGTVGDVNGDGYADVIVGAYGYDSGQTQEGMAFVYHGSPTGLNPVKAWTAQSDQDNALFGWTVATAGDVDGDGYADALVGARQYTNGQTNEGRVFLYPGSATGLAAVAGWTAEGDQASSNFGNAVGPAGDVNGDGYADVVIGANKYDNGQADEGRALVFFGSATGLSASAAWTAESDQLSGRFGVAVATAGDVDGDGYSDLLVGADFYDNGQTDEGRAYVYHGSSAGLAPEAGWTAESGQTDTWYGYAVSTAGDVDGDGYADVIVGAPYFDNGEIDEGRAFLYHGSASGLSPTAAWTTESDQDGAQLGFAVNTAGDVNGDGYADVIIGALTYDNVEYNEGRAYVYHGSATGLSTVADWTGESDQEQSRYGFPVGTAGDVNGDGYADVIIGAHIYDNVELDEGRAYVYHGSATGLSTVADWTGESHQERAAYGISASTAGDVNGDGYSDVIVGADLYDNGQTDEGLVYVYHGSATGLSTTEAWTAEGDQAVAIFGRSAGSAGDVNGDGYADVIIGADRYDNGQTDEGGAFVYHGSAAGLSTTANWTTEGDQNTAYLGFYTATGTAGDVNGDGYADVIVGAYGYSNIQSEEGRALVYLGSAAGLPTTPAWTVESNQSGAKFGLSTGTAGDVNGDGYADIIVGAPFFDNVEADEGRAFIYYGNNGPGLSLKPQQRRSDNTAPIAPLCMSDVADGLRLALLGRTPFGRGKVKLEWEVKPLGTPFDGAGTSTSTSWIDTGAAGVAINQLVTGLSSPETLYHWRVRLRYHPAQVPLQQTSRWLTVPWNGWQEADLRTGVAGAAGRVPDGNMIFGEQLLITKGGSGSIALRWGDSCRATDTDYEIYEGRLGDFRSHTPKLCSTGGETRYTIDPAPDSRYYLIVPRNTGREGSYGQDSGGEERPAGVDACLIQDYGGC